MLDNRISRDRWHSWRLDSFPTFRRARYNGGNHLIPTLWYSLHFYAKTLLHCATATFSLWLLITFHCITRSAHITRRIPCLLVPPPPPHNDSSRKQKRASTKSDDEILMRYTSKLLLLSHQPPVKMIKRCGRAFHGVLASNFIYITWLWLASSNIVSYTSTYIIGNWQQGQYPIHHGRR